MPIEEQPIPLSIEVHTNSGDGSMTIKFSQPATSLTFNAVAAADFCATIAQGIAKMLAPAGNIIQAPPPGIAMPEDNGG